MCPLCSSDSVILCLFNSCTLLSIDCSTMSALLLARESCLSDPCWLSALFIWWLIGRSCSDAVLCWARRLSALFDSRDDEIRDCVWVLTVLSGFLTLASPQTYLRSKWTVLFLDKSINSTHVYPSASVLLQCHLHYHRNLWMCHFASNILLSP